jgi:DNA-directed RNA polymerase subunit M/transcription elongation factor TFIIS
MRCAKMEFCEKCRNMLVPVKEEKTTYLMCNNCGKKTKISKSTDYKIVRKIEHKPSEKLEVTELKKRRKLTDEEREELEDSYGDMLELMDVE